MSAERVLHVIPALAPRYGGPSVATVGMCRALEAAGLAVLVLSTDADGPGRLPVRVGQEQSYEGLRTLFFPRRLGEAFKWSAGMSHWLSRHVSEFDLVHIHAVFSHSSIAAGRACQKQGIPYIVRPLGTLDPWSIRRKRLRKQALLRLGGQGLLLAAAAVHYTSSEEMRLAESVVLNLPRGVVIPLGLEESAFADTGSATPKGTAPYVLALSRLDEKKGLDLLIRAFHSAKHDGQHAGWRLVIAGDGDQAYLSALRNLADAGSAKQQIEFRGWVGGEAKAALLRGASLFAAPSHQENFGISLVEALAAGIPAIVTPGVNLAQEIQSAGGGWVVDRDETALAGALGLAMSDAAELERRGQLARGFADQFRWPAVAQKLLALYNRLSVPSLAA